MKKALFLVALVTLVVWLAQGAPASSKTEPARDAAAPESAAPNAVPSLVTPQGSCCVNPDQTDPHWECFEGACVQVPGCGANVNCATCGCSSSDEWACINGGGYWDSSTCTCDYGCDPYGTQQQACISQGGYWDPNNCFCTYSCDPTGSQRQACLNMGWDWSQTTCTCTHTNVCVCEDEELISHQTYDYEYCDGYYYQYCTDNYDTYYQYCDGTCGPRQWTDQYTTCVSYYEYCGSGGGGGGGGGEGCYYNFRPDGDGKDSGKTNSTPGTNLMDDCWCDWGWGICCDFDDYCWEM